MDRKRIIVGVSGGIAAYKAASVVRQLVEAGHSVRVIPTESALRFVGAATFEALCGEPVHTDVWHDVPDVPHVQIGKQADLVVVAPATADVLARAAHGRADDLLTATLLTARCPVLFAPAMHTEMWLHPATVDNVATLRRRGAVVLEPASGRLTGSDTGAGRLPEPEEITTFAELLLARGDAMPHDLAGCKVLVTAGGTREPIDPVRFIGNRSSGKQGYAVARVAAQRGADVTLIAAHTAGLADPAGVHVVHVSSAAQLGDAVSKHAPDAHVLVMAAAVADFRPAQASSSKIKKGTDKGEGSADDRADQNRRRVARCRAGARGRAAAQHARDRRFCRRDRRRERHGPRPCARQAEPQGLRFAGSQRGRRRPRVRGGQQRRVAARGGRHGGRAGARFQDADGQPYCGRDRDVPARRDRVGVQTALRKTVRTGGNNIIR